MPLTTRPDLPIIPFASRGTWEVWLEEHHAASDGLWLKIAKKGSGIETVTFAEALDVALCYGWIDSQRSGFDERFFLQRFTPRKPRSKWSKVNCGKVTKLIEAGEMKPAGLREVERAKADGRWDAAYEPQSKATAPDDLRKELEKNEGAREFFATLDSRNRYAILHRIQDAKKPETRARRIEKYVAMLSEQKKIYP
ncbi:MAG: YdeI/OmpD-associated family protein [Rubrobacteraceae bacterium]|nr:YdeI/OmpD-associated family protein [Rubrobacter sp.]